MAQTDSIINIPNSDSVIAKQSVALKKIQDSFYSIQPQYKFFTNSNSSAFKQLLSKTLDTNAIISKSIVLIETKKVKFDKNQMPIAEERIYQGENVIIKVTNRDINEYIPKRVFVNNVELKIGKNLDTRLCDSEFIKVFELEKSSTKLITYNNKKILYTCWFIEKCNGSGCGTSYNLLYDLDLKRGIIVEQYRVSDFFVGKTKGENHLAFLVFKDVQYNYLYNNFPLEAKIYHISDNGNLISSTSGEQYFFSGYYKDSDDSIFILNANFPKIKRIRQ